MSTRLHDEPTVLTGDVDRRRLSLALYPVRLVAGRIVADCERMLDSLADGEHRAWRDAIGTALLAARQLLAIARQGAEIPASTHSTDRIAALAARVAEPQSRIVDSMKALLEFVPVSIEEELLLRDARAIRLMAFDCFAMPGETPVTSARDAPPVIHQPRGATERPRVLVADDEANMRKLLRRMLMRAGYDVVEAENGRQALDAARSEPVDLVLTDINMPEMDGISLLQQLKSVESTRDIPVIVVSSQGDLASVATSIELGAEDHLSKPYEAVLLQARVRASLERKRMRDLERDYLRRVAGLTAAAEAVERDSYVAGSLDALASGGDELGRLARVFDRVVSGLKSREERLERRLRHLRREISEPSGRAVAHEESNGSPFNSGDVLAARYEILGQLGQGGMGMVYRARDLELGEEVAVKVVRRDLTQGDASIFERLKSEIRLTRKISHRNVVRAHDLGEWQGTYFISMEYVKGITVADLLDRRGRLGVDSTLAIGTQLAEALAVAHEQQIIHRDIKPANLLVDEDGVLKVMDFGIARSMERDDRLTLGGFIVGTPQYMAPEQLMGRPADERSDLFAVGVVLYECLAGRPPFMADSPMTLMADVADQNTVRLRQLVPEVTPSLESIIHQLLTFQPAGRIGSARELAACLAETEHAIRQDLASHQGARDPATLVLTPREG